MGATIIGEVVMDRFVRADGSFVDVPGGSASNTAIALQRSGVATALRARFSTDAIGRALRTYNTEQSLDLSASPDVAEPASLVVIHVASDGQPVYEFHLTGRADWHWTREDLATPLPAGTELVHVGSLASVVEPGASRIRDWLASLDPRPLISFDPNARPSAAHSEAEADAMRDAVEAWCKVADFIKVSDEDLRWLSPTDDGAARAASWSQHCSFVVMTRGARGAALFVEGALAFEVPGEVVDVVDTVGAGDTFMAWLIKGVLEATHGQSFASLAHDTPMLRTIATRAGRAAAINCSRRGCNPPDADEV